MPIIWKSQVVRLTAFLPEAFDVARAASGWQSMVGQPPETDEVRAREGVRRQGGSLDDDANFELVVQPNRIDWVIVPKPTVAVPGPGDVGSPAPRLKQIVDLVMPWIKAEVPSVSRIAVGNVFVTPVTDRKAGYRMLLDLAPSLRFNPEDEISDLLFQINRLKPSSVVNHRINRLMKFSVGRHQQMTLDPGALSSNLGVTEFVGRLEVDLNTEAVAGVTFDYKAIIAILNELSSMALQIAERGEMA